MFAARYLPGLLFLLLLPGCADTSYRFERVASDPPVVLPLQFDGVTGFRDGSAVQAGMNFSDGPDSARIDILLHLTPQAEFQSGTYRITLDGETQEGRVEAAALSFLGGQSGQPGVGGVFILQDAAGQPLYRVRVPATTLTRQ